MILNTFNLVMLIVLFILIVCATFLIGLFVGIESGKKYAAKQMTEAINAIIKELGNSDN